uniref:Uncharacterized protein n=1 Tax=uncultured microorganism TaxID=358574 RepID=K0J3U0_9ZZZZ|nr:putative uncharacterized protein [uncultured microorganism]
MVESWIQGMPSVTRLGRKRLSMKKKYRIFFAIPFDSASTTLYERVCKKIKMKISKQHPELEFTTVIGDKEVGPSETLSDIASFKKQNKELTGQFVAQIRESDVVIADVTHNNPNVHVELGIALMQNKNILRVTGRSLTELGFDIRNLKMWRYDKEKKLIKTITDYLDTFLKIKQLSISSGYGSLYWKQSKKTELRPVPPEGQKKRFAYKSIRSDNYVMRDGAVRAEFEILKEHNPEDNWFGVYFRAGVWPLMVSYLVFVRPNGTVQLSIYPGPRSPSKSTGEKIKERKTLLIEFDNNQLNVELDSKPYLQTEKLVRQAVGHIFVAAWNADVDVHSVEMICRDTIDWS